MVISCTFSTWLLSPEIHVLIGHPHPPPLALSWSVAKNSTEEEAAAAGSGPLCSDLRANCIVFLLPTLPIDSLRPEGQPKDRQQQFRGWRAKREDENGLMDIHYNNNNQKKK